MTTDSDHPPWMVSQKEKKKKGLVFKAYRHLVLTRAWSSYLLSASSYRLPGEQVNLARGFVVGWELRATSSRQFKVQHGVGLLLHVSPPSAPRHLSLPTQPGLKHGRLLD